MRMAISATARPWAATAGGTCSRSSSSAAHSAGEKHVAVHQPVGHAPVILGSIHVLVDEFVDHGHIDGVLLQSGEQGAQAALLAPIQDAAGYDVGSR